MASTSSLAASSRPRSAGGAVGDPDDEQDASTAAAINAAATLSFRVIMKS